MTKFTIRHTFDIGVDEFWEKIFFDDEFNRRLYLDTLQFKDWKVLEKTDKGGGVIERRVHCEPKSDAPAVVKKLVGDSMAYVEKGRFDPSSKRWKWEIIPSKLADKMKIAGEFWLESRGDKRSERFTDVDLQVKIFGVGGVVEGFVEKQVKDSYDIAARFTNKWIKDKGL